MRRLQLHASRAALAAVLAVPVTACGHFSGYPPPAAVRPQDVLSFDTLYSQNCAACHGSEGKNGQATDLANPEYQALVDDASLRKWVSAGMPGTQMPAFAQSANGMLTDAQVSAIVAGMRKMWSRTNAFAGATPPAYAQVQAGDATRGQQTYQARCAICHASAPGQITDPVYLALISDQALRGIIIAGSPDIGQPDWRHDSKNSQPAPPLSDQDVNDIVSYLASLRNSAPAYAGTAALPQPAPAGGKH
jgi:mono/diheme cytochrome c family protein